MGYTKRQFVTAAFEELGLADYAHDLQPQDLQMAVRRLDAMMAEWNGRGLRLGYPLVSDPENTLLDTETGVQDAANEAIITNLGIRIAPSFGRQVMQETMNTARRAYQVILSKSIGTLLTYFKTTFTDPVFITAVNSPVTGATITQPDDSTNQWAILTPAGTIATLTIVLPAVANLVDGQEILVTSSQIVTALTLNLNGATSADGVTAMTANGQFKLKYNLQTTSWYKVV